MKIISNKLILLLWVLATMILFVYQSPDINAISTKTLESSQLRRVNIPYFEDDVHISQAAIFWFGKVDQENNYADVRIGYNSEELVIRVQVFDKRLWYDKIPAVTSLTEWDSVSLFLNPSGNVNNVPTSDMYHLVAQINHWQPRDEYQAAFQGNGSKWTLSTTPFETISGWRGTINDGKDARGWTMDYKIPFSSLGLSESPATGSEWGFAVAVYDRDDENDAMSITTDTWPEMASTDNPLTWGQLSFGLPFFAHEPASFEGSTIIRQGLTGITVSDGQVGGHSTCGAPFGPDYFDGWGDANYSGYDQINIQNQSDVADWPCFSKFYVTFPIKDLPTHKVIMQSTLVMHQFGGANPTQAQSSLIQVSSTDSNWNENSLTWNTAPLAQENFSGSWVNPLIDFPSWPGVPIAWDVSQAVTNAYASGKSVVNFVLYSADTAYHSGKYFSTSDTLDWNSEARPTLEVDWGTPVYGLSVSPTVNHIATGDTAEFDISINHTNGFDSDVIISVANSSPDLEINLTNNIISSPGGVATLFVTDKSSVSSGRVYELLITTSGQSVTKTDTAYLFINGSQIFLPNIAK